MKSGNSSTPLGKSLLTATLLSATCFVQAADSLVRTDGVTASARTLAWSQDELQRIVKADDLKVSPFREDGKTYGTPTWIWCVEVDGALYVRAYSGVQSTWYQAAVREKEGRIIAAGMTRDVFFEPVSGDINERIDDAYRVKYKSSPYMEPMISERARAATVKILPKDSGN